jgi:hypothetical protein
MEPLVEKYETTRNGCAVKELIDVHITSKYFHPLLDLRCMTV